MRRIQLFQFILLMKENKYLIFVLLFLIVNISFFVCYQNVLSELTFCHYQNRNAEQIQYQREKALLSIINNSFINDGRSLCNLELVDENGNKGKLSHNLVVNTNKLVFFFSDKNCITCIDSALYHLNNWSDSIGMDNIIVIVSYENSYRLNVLRKLKKIQFPIYNVYKQNMDRYDLERDFPFFFVLTIDLSLQNLFIADKSLSEITDNYFRATVKNYFSKLP